MVRRGAAAEALEALASAPSRELISAASLFNESRKAGLVSRVPGLDEEPRVVQLHSLFDVALENGLCSVIVHYVYEVCYDEYAVSSDPVEAELLDARVVEAWCLLYIKSIRDKVIGSGGVSGGGTSKADRLQELAAALEGLLHVLSALGEPLIRRKETVEGDEDARGDLEEVLGAQAEASCLLRHVAALEWLALHGEVPPSGASRWGSDTHWAGDLGKRRAAAHPDNLFLDDLVTAKGQEVAYPPERLESLAGSLFGVSSGRGKHAEDAGAGLFMYALLDQGWSAGDAAGAAASLGAGAEAIRRWHTEFLLDDLEVGSLDEACRLLPALATPSTPFKVVRALLRRGRPDCALAVMRARGGGGGGVGGAGPDAGAGAREEEVETAPPLEEAVESLQVRLACGCLGEAFGEQRKAAAAAGTRGGEYAARLMEALCVWCESEGALTVLLNYPLDAREEDAVVGWLERRAQARARAGELLPLYYLQRCRYPEALHAHARLGARAAGGEAWMAEAARQRAAVLRAAGQLLPGPQRALSVVPSSSGGAGLSVRSGGRAPAPEPSAPDAMATDGPASPPTTLGGHTMPGPMAQGSTLESTGAMLMDSELDPPPLFSPPVSAKRPGSSRRTPGGGGGTPATGGGLAARTPGSAAGGGGTMGRWEREQGAAGATPLARPGRLFGGDSPAATPQIVLGTPDSHASGLSGSTPQRRTSARLARGGGAGGSKGAAAASPVPVFFSSPPPQSPAGGGTPGVTTRSGATARGGGVPGPPTRSLDPSESPGQLQQSPAMSPARVLRSAGKGGKPPGSAGKARRARARSGYSMAS